MALRVIGAGYGRTGTLSLRTALERLGFAPCEHMINVMENPERFLLWQAALEQKERGGAIDWDPLFAGYSATVDWPGAFFWRELANANPRAKVILTVRDPDRWYDSVRQTIYRARLAFGPAPVTRMLTAIAGEKALAGAYEAALREGYLWHEFGDTHLILK